MNVANETTNKALVLVALDTLFNKRDYWAAAQYWWSDLILHCAHSAPGRRGLFDFVKTAPATLRYEPGLIVANEDYVIVHGRMIGNGRPMNWIIATILRIEGACVAEQWQLFEEESSQMEFKSEHPIPYSSHTRLRLRPNKTRRSCYRPWMCCSINATMSRQNGFGRRHTFNIAHTFLPAAMACSIWFTVFPTHSATKIT
jgi:predicted SnoaL-like aldol condensation-catalyzing enzyme